MKEATTFRKATNKSLKKHVTGLPVKSVLNIGAVPDLPDKEGSTYRDYFPNTEWYTVDMRRGKEYENHYYMDLHDLSGIDRTFDLILNMSTLEHVKNPFTVTENLKALLNPKGYMFVVVPYSYRRHATSYGDYWRFTDDALRYVLFSDMKEIMLESTPIEDDWGWCGLYQKV